MSAEAQNKEPLETIAEASFLSVKLAEALLSGGLILIAVDKGDRYESSVYSTIRDKEMISDIFSRAEQEAISLQK